MDWKWLKSSKEVIAEADEDFMYRVVRDAGGKPPRLQSAFVCMTHMSNKSECPCMTLFFDHPELASLETLSELVRGHGCVVSLSLSPVFEMITGREEAETEVLNTPHA